MTCDRLEQNLAACNCTYRCCECVAYHRSRGELPACYFDAAAERTYDRSIANFVRLNS